GARGPDVRVEGPQGCRPRQAVDAVPRELGSAKTCVCQRVDVPTTNPSRVCTPAGNAVPEQRRAEDAKDAEEGRFWPLPSSAISARSASLRFPCSVDGRTSRGPRPQTRHGPRQTVDALSRRLGLLAVVLLG